VTRHNLPWSEACERNKQPILDQLRVILEHECDEIARSGGEHESGRQEGLSDRKKPIVLEIGSGTGQHVVYFSAALTHWTWQPTDRPINLDDLSLRVQMEGGANVLAPIALDVFGVWPEQRYSAVFSANTAHIMSWRAVEAMFAGVAGCLRPAGQFILYGPFNENGRYSSVSNERFDASLKLQDPAMGLRDLVELQSLAHSVQMKLTSRRPMPANNEILVFKHETRVTDSGETEAR